MEVERTEDYPYASLDMSSPTIRLLRLQRDGSDYITGWVEAF
jgi:hypothetical protein